MPSNSSSRCSKQRLPTSSVNVSNTNPQRSSTPMTHKISSVRFTSHEPSLKVDALKDILERELEGAIIEKADKLVETVFPDRCLPLGNWESLTRDLAIAQPPAIQCDGEDDVASWMNGIGDAVQQRTQSHILRKWSAQYCNTPLNGSPHTRKPDIILLDAAVADSISSGYELKWHDVRALSEITSQESFHMAIKATVAQKSYIMFLTQCDRRFVTALSFHGDRFRFCACDRAGVVHTSSFPIARSAGLVNPTLLRIIIGLMFATNSTIGYDQMMTRGPDGQIVKIMVKGKEYKVIQKVFSSESLRGRATQCWHVRRVNEDGNVEEYIIKDSWVHTGHTANEVEFLEKLRGVVGVPNCVDSEDVTLPDGTVDSTATRCNGCRYDEVRVNRRLVMQPVGELLTSFTCKKELVRGFRDLARGA